MIRNISSLFPVTFIMKFVPSRGHGKYDENIFSLFPVTFIMIVPSHSSKGHCWYDKEHF